MSLTVSSTFSHTSSSPLASSISCSFQLSPPLSCHPSPASTSSTHCVSPQLISGDCRPTPTTPQRPSLSISTTYFSSTSSSSSSSSSAAVHLSSPRSPGLIPIRPASAPSPSLHRSRSPLAQLSLAFSSSVPVHPVPSHHHPFLHRPCGNDTLSNCASSSCTVQPVRPSTVCRLTAASSPALCHAASNCIRVHAVKHYSDHSEYDGEVCSRTGVRNGPGVFVNRHGDRYSGQWQDDKRHGDGEYSWHTGDRYIGEWQQGSMSGSGTFHWHNGDRFTGGWLDGHMHGTGTKTLHNGDVITGTWQLGRQQGKGTKLFACGDKHTGLYKDDRRHGHGVYIWASGDTYVGSWHEGRMHGQGSKYMCSGDHYLGAWVRDKAEGEGKKVFSSGDVHSGGYEADMRQGWGVYVWVSGDKYEGWWNRGVQEGRGTYYYASGDAYKGRWEGGRKQGRGIYSSVTQHSSFVERWDKGVRRERLPCRFYPPRLLRTDKDENTRRGSVVAARSNADGSQSSSGSLKPDEEFGDEDVLLLPAALPLTPLNSAACVAPAPAASSTASPSPTPPAEDGMCRVCYERAIDCVLLRCGHYALCMQCSNRMEHCPFCRQPIQDVVLVYKP